MEAITERVPINVSRNLPENVSWKNIQVHVGVITGTDWDGVLDSWGRWERKWNESIDLRSEGWRVRWSGRECVAVNSTVNKYMEVEHINLSEVIQLCIIVSKLDYLPLLMVEEVFMISFRYAQRTHTTWYHWGNRRDPSGATLVRVFM